MDKTVETRLSIIETKMEMLERNFVEIKSDIKSISQDIHSLNQNLSNSKSILGGLVMGISLVFTGLIEGAKHLWSNLIK